MNLRIDKSNRNDHNNRINGDEILLQTHMLLIARSEGNDYGNLKRVRWQRRLKYTLQKSSLTNIMSNFY